ncbi:type II CAAX endopeptidase family protein [Xenorhabdus khoisanae]|uniref:CPBP family intramembrane glutamic endopeptidase n=1 Tax=Xenorhabdus khoisanae TaxID=880157 RepID=UPI002358B083|nr:type II CAAX endopeptidase family protein [Xenorhabdus khoisanae]MDC9615796.1 type II CAAX endopeptidase family protein [Xenorhabdus khoisanae]
MKLFRSELMYFLKKQLIAAILVLGWFTVVFVVSYWVVIYGYADDNMFTLYLFVILSLPLLIYSYSRWVYQLSFGHLKITTSLGLAIGVIVFYLAIYYIKKSFGIHFEPFLFQLLEHTKKTGENLLSFYIVIFMLAPVCEEILFRGIFLNVFKSKYSWTLWLGALITSLILASFFLIDNHVSLFIESFILALMRATARIRSGGLLLPILLHVEAAFMAIVMGGLNSPYQNYIWF